MNLFETLPFIFLIQTCTCFSNYVIFNGFGAKDTDHHMNTQNKTINVQSSDNITEDILQIHDLKNSTSLDSTISTEHDNKPKRFKSTTRIDSTISTELENKPKRLHNYNNTENTTRAINVMIDSIVAVGPTVTDLITIDIDEENSLKPAKKFQCPEEEIPSNIGPYVIPTERDLVLHIGTVLARLFANYHRRSFNFLSDIKEASKATIEVENTKCIGIDKILYRQCVKRVTYQFRLLIKNLVNSMENQKQYIQDLLEGKICTLDQLPNLHLDPIDMLKRLSVEGITLQLGLPGFLRMLSTCTIHCNGSLPRKIKRRDDMNDILMRYMLSAKDYQAIVAKMDELNI